MLSRSQVKQNAIEFAARWAEETRERAESQTFWNEFLAIFGIDRRQVAWYEHHVSPEAGGDGYIDVFWPGKLICEQKSAHRNLDAAYDQALRYLLTLPVKDRPLALVVSDFRRVRIYSPDGEGRVHEFLLADLPENLHMLWFLQDEANGIEWDQEQPAATVKASEKLGELHDLLLDAGYPKDALEILLVRVLFCFFAEDAGIFERRQFTRWIKEHSEQSGANVGSSLLAFFEVLDQPEQSRMKTLSDELRRLPYVNGGLFKGVLPVPAFDAAMRSKLMECAEQDWADISPSIFGSIFQSIMEEGVRRSDGAHYTSEEYILRLIGPLFLDDLVEELKDAGYNPHKLRALQKKIASLKFLDPACGSGNFLTVTYKHLRRLEDMILLRLFNGQMVIDIDHLVTVSIGQFYGIEVMDTEIAKVSLWLAEHQANRRTAKEFGKEYVHLPLDDYENIARENALRFDWNGLLPANECSYVFGNPPFVGAAYQSADQKDDLRAVWGDKAARYLDYVTGWYKKTADYYSETSAGEWGYVSTNSVAQGESVRPLLEPIFRAGWSIKFAHQTFIWDSEARQKAHVHVVIIGFTRDGKRARRLFTYGPSGVVQEKSPAAINAYLADGPAVWVEARPKPLAPDISPARRGSEPTGKGLIVDAVDYEKFASDPIAAKYLRKYFMGMDLIRGDHRWCLWMVDLQPGDLGRSSLLKARIDSVRTDRLGSTKAATRKKAETPYLFGENNQPTYAYLGIPAVFSNARRWATGRYLHSDVIAGNKVYTCPDEDGFQFAVLSSAMFITWQRAVGGRLKSDPNFSSTIVWNNLPLPSVSPDLRASIIAAGKGVIAARDLYPEASLAQLYEPGGEPVEIINAHKRLDELVDRAFGAPSTCASNEERLSILFGCYTELTSVGN